MVVGTIFSGIEYPCDEDHKKEDQAFSSSTCGGSSAESVSSYDDSERFDLKLKRKDSVEEVVSGRGKLHLQGRRGYFSPCGWVSHTTASKGQDVDQMSSEQLQMPSTRENSPMPRTREASPEPLWESYSFNPCIPTIDDLLARHNQVQAHTQSNVHESSSDRPLLLCDLAPSAANPAVQVQPPAFGSPDHGPGMVNLLFGPDQGLGMGAAFPMPNNLGGMPPPMQPPAMAPPPHMLSGMPAMPLPYPTPMQFQALPQCIPLEVAAPCKVLVDPNLQSKPKPARAKKQKAAVHSKPSGTTESRQAPPTGDDILKNMSEDKREALCEYIYLFMTKKGLTSPAGYLVVDVLSNVWREMFTQDDASTGWQIGKHRFISLLRSSPKYFDVLDKNLPQGTIRVAIRKDIGENSKTAPVSAPAQPASTPAPAAPAAPALADDSVAAAVAGQPAAAPELQVTAESSSEKEAPVQEETQEMPELSASETEAADCVAAKALDDQLRSEAAPMKSWADVVRSGA